MRLTSVPLVATGDVAAWVGAVGTCVVGLLAAWIAYVQYRHSKFRPQEWAYRDRDGRVLVRVVNVGAGAGVVQDVNLLGPHHEETQRMELFQWELRGAPSNERPVPFTLAGGASAHLFLIPGDGVSSEGLRARVDYAADDSGCLDIEEVEGRLFGTTFIDKVTT